MRNNIRKMQSISLVVILFLSAFCLLIGSNGVVEAAPPGPPGGGKKPPPPPSASLTLGDLENAFDPNPVVQGQALTYTLKLTVEGTMDATDVSLELLLVGDQKFVGVDPGSSGWTLVTPVTDRVHFDIGKMTKGQKAEVKVFTIAPTNLSRPAIQQSAYVKWTDINAYYNKEFTLKAALAAPPSNVSPLPAQPELSTPVSLLPTSGPFAPQKAPESVNQVVTENIWYFSATKHYLSYGFLAYWRSHGDVISLGWPISEEFMENGQDVQYFERGVLEYHPDNPDPYKTLLRSLGRETGKAEPSLGGDAPDAGAVFFPETGQWLSGQFVKAWNTGGGLMQYGYPISTQTTVGNKLIQWTERARFEVDISRPNQLVTLGLVGREYAITKGYLAQ
jgi:hypothetical protein